MGWSLGPANSPPGQLRESPALRLSPGRQARLANGSNRQNRHRFPAPVKLLLEPIECGLEGTKRLLPIPQSTAWASPSGHDFEWPARKLRRRQSARPAFELFPRPSAKCLHTLPLLRLSLLHAPLLQLQLLQTSDFGKSKSLRLRAIRIALPNDCSPNYWNLAWRRLKVFARLEAFSFKGHWDFLKRNNLGRKS